MRNAPSMTGLRVLEAVIRTGSLSAAARELCVTPAAISHRLRSLEAHAGAGLAERSEGRFVATAKGKRILVALGDAFMRIRAADAILSAADGPGLRVVASYSFAVLWLAPRLARFEAMHPGIELILEPSHSPLEGRGADVTILHASQPPTEPGWTRLFADHCAVVGRADHPLLARPDAGPGDVLDGRLVTIEHGRGANFGEFSWQNWGEALGLAPPRKVKGPVVTAEHLAVDLILAEDALALVSLVNTSRLLEQGRLQVLAGSELASGCSYWVRGTESPRLDAAALVVWLTDQLAGADHLHIAGRPAPSQG
jgi:LysR family glycine cleavage system transcriptional activator